MEAISEASVCEKVDISRYYSVDFCWHDSLTVTADREGNDSCQDDTCSAGKSVPSEKTIFEKKRPEHELDWLGMSLNVRKSACIRIGPRFSIVVILY